MKFIKQSSIDSVLEDARIYDVVKASEDLKQKGANWFCLSPFVQEKSPSFCVNPVKNNFFDYAGGFGGNPITFLRKKHNISFFEAIEMAAKICNLVLEYEEQSEDAMRMHDEEQSMKQFVEFASEQYQMAYNKLDDQSWPKQMMQVDRGYNEETLQTFMIGFAPNVQSFISTPAINQAKYEISKTLGFTNTKDGSSWDFFRDRIMFPVHNDRGVIVGFGGRRNNGEEFEKYAKYLNSKESRVYLKEKILYGFWQAKKKIAELDKAVLLEGYTDVMSVHQGGLLNSVATCGTALSPFHVKLLSRVTKNVVLFRDGDAAGIRAAKRDMSFLLKDGINVTIVIAPEGEDPDSLSRKCNISEFVTKNEEDAILWLANVLHAESKNPDLPKLEKAVRTHYEKEIEALRGQIAPDTAFKSLSATDKKFLKKANDDLFKEIGKLDKDLQAELRDFPKYEPSALAHSVDTMASTLFLIPNKIKQEQYVKLCARILDVKPNQINQIIQTREEEEEKERKARSKDAEQKEVSLLGLPKGADPDQYLADRFCEIGNRYHFHNGTSFFVGTNFRMVPLFHVEGKMDNKRLCEVINDKGHKRLIDFESTDLINFTKIKERLIQEGFFFWEPGTSVSHFQLVAKKLLNEFITATELKILGHQRQGFFAFADGVYNMNQFHKVNKYGIVHVEGLEKEDTEYRSDISHFYSPSHSEIYKAANEGDDPYENDRHFVYKIAPISMDQWMQQMVNVFGNKGIFGVAFCIASNFRDLFLDNYKYFPLMGGFGQRDSGKSGFGKCLQSFFYYNLPALELNTSTLVGISRRLTRCKNTVVFFDEYRDDIDEDKHQQLKGGWNGIGREKGKGFDSNRTSIDRINSAIYYAGQYLPTKDDGALPSRSIILNFEQKERSSEEKEAYNNLMNLDKQGISSFVLDVVRHRDTVKKELTKTYAEVSRDLKLSLKDTEYQNRIFDNYLVLLVVVKLLEDKFSFPFSYKEYFSLTKEAIIENSDTISDSDGLAAFWRVIEYLANPEMRSIREGHDYEIEKAYSIVYVPKKNEKATYTNTAGDKILFLDFSKVHQDYHKEVTKRQGEEVIGQTTIRNYLKSKKYFIGLYSSRRMESRSSSGYAFNYSMMERMGILNLPNGCGDQQTIDLPETKKHTIITNPDQITANL